MNQLDAFREEINAGHMEAIAPMRDYLAERGESRLAMGLEYIERLGDAVRFDRCRPYRNDEGTGDVWTVSGPALPTMRAAYWHKTAALTAMARLCADKLNECCGRLWWKPDDCPCREEQRRLCEAINAAGHDFTEEQILDLADWYATKEWGRIEAAGLYVLVEYCGIRAMRTQRQKCGDEWLWQNIVYDAVVLAVKAQAVCRCGWFGNFARSVSYLHCPVCKTHDLKHPREVLAKIGKLHLCTEEQ